MVSRLCSILAVNGARRALAISCATALVVAAAGCGTSKKNSRVAVPGAAVATSAGTPNAHDLFVRYAACLRAHGIPDAKALPGPASGVGWVNGTRAVVSAADRACRDILKPQEQPRTAASDARFRDGMFAFARCLRKQGIDVGDPILKRVAGGFDVSFPDPQPQESPRWNAAAAVCNRLNPLLKPPE